MLALALVLIVSCIALGIGMVTERELFQMVGVVGTLGCVVALLAAPIVILWRQMAAAEVHPAFRQVRQSALLGAAMLGLLGVRGFFGIPVSPLFWLLLVCLCLAGLVAWVAAGRRAQAAPAAKGMAYSVPMGVAVLLALLIALTADKWH